MTEERADMTQEQVRLGVQLQQWMQGLTPMMTPIFTAQPTLEETEFPLLGSPTLPSLREKIPQDINTNKYTEYRTPLEFSPALTPQLQATRLTPMMMMQHQSIESLINDHHNSSKYSEMNHQMISSPSMFPSQPNFHGLLNGTLTHSGSAEILRKGNQNRKSSHKMAEQKRRDGLKELFDELRRLLGGTSRMEVLQNAVEYIKQSKEAQEVPDQIKNN